MRLRKHSPLRSQAVRKSKWILVFIYLSAFVTCFLPIVIVYYPLMLCGTNLARSGRSVARANMRNGKRFFMRVRDRR